MPAVYLNYIIPPYAKVESLIVSQSNINQISGSYLIYPAQPPHKPGETIPWVDPDSLIYNSDELFPGEFVRIVSQGVMDGARIVTIEVRPLQYRPKSKRLFLVRNITFEFSFGSNTIPELRPQIRGRCEQAVYDAAIRNVVVNDYEVPLYYQTPTLVEENQIGTLAPIPGAPGVIITPSEFFDAFQGYANWMTDQGIRTILITPEYIYSVFPQGRDNPEKIRLYMQWCYKHAGGTYFILGGDDYFVPVRYCYSLYSVPPEDSNFSVPCDMYFLDLTGEWDKNNNRLWGEIDDDEADRFPEVYVGRVTSYCVQEVDNWVDKVLGYEKSPNLVDSVALWLYKDMAIGDAPTVFPDYFQHLYVEMINAEQAVEYLSQGYAFNNIYCHGVRDTFSDCPATIKVAAYWPFQPSPSYDGLNNLENFNKYIFVYSLACHNGGYDSHWIDPGTQGEIAPTDTCIADGFIDTYNNSIGACAFLDYTRATRLSYSYDLEYEFYNCFFSPYTGPYPFFLGVKSQHSTFVVDLIC